MVNQNKIFSFKIKRQSKNIFPRDVERTVVRVFVVRMKNISILGYPAQADLNLHWAHMSKDTFSDIVARLFLTFIHIFHFKSGGNYTYLTLSLAEHDMPCFSKQRRSRSVGF